MTRETAADLKNPYPGLRPFEPEDAGYFFGRGRQVGELLLRLRDHRFVAVLGLSGSGKSSLVRAGLIPAWKAGHLTSSGSRWRVALFRPGSQPVEALAAALEDVLGDRSNRLASLGASTRALLLETREGRGADESLLVVLDQFEEIFRVPDAHQAAHFIDLSPDGRRMVTASADNSARVWEADTGKPEGALLEHQGAVSSAAFSLDGRRVVTASYDNTARVWNVLIDCCASQSDADRLATLAEAVSGYEVSETGSLTALVPAERLERLRKVGRSIGTRPAPALSLDWLIRQFTAGK